MYLVENDNSERKDKYCESRGVAECGPAEFADAEHPELECFDDACKRICLHEHFEARVFDGAERINYRGCVHPKLYDETEQKSEVAVLGGEAAEQHAETERERGDEQYKYRREQCVQIRVHWRIGKN